jgi:vacuolar-type H+-ATPase subunit I/STV1
MQDYEQLKQKLDKINKHQVHEKKKEIEFSQKIDELNQETDTLLEEIDKWQM